MYARDDRSTRTPLERELSQGILRGEGYEDVDWVIKKKTVGILKEATFEEEDLELLSRAGFPGGLDL